jgi:hypothetical protein
MREPGGQKKKRDNDRVTELVGRFSIRRRNHVESPTSVVAYLKRHAIKIAIGSLSSLVGSFLGTLYLTRDHLPAASEPPSVHTTPPIPAPTLVPAPPVGNVPDQHANAPSLPRKTKPRPNFVQGILPFPLDPRIVNQMPRVVYAPYGIDGMRIWFCYDIPFENSKQTTEACYLMQDLLPKKN